MAYNRRQANKGQVFEEVVKMANKVYERQGIALVQKISTPWKVIRRGEHIVKAYPEEKSTLDFRGTVALPLIGGEEGIKAGLSISFDCKETEEKDGLMLKHIQPHQIDYMEKALAMGEITFVLCNSTVNRQYYFIHGSYVVERYRYWQDNKGKRGGVNRIRFEDMEPIKQKRGITIDYLDRFRPTPFKEVSF